MNADPRPSPSGAPSAAAAAAAPAMLRLYAHGGTGCVEFELFRGSTYHVVASRREQRQALLDEIAAATSAAFVSPDGGLISTLKVWENIALPVWYHASPITRELEHRTEELFSDVGLDAAAAAEIAKRLPGELSHVERRLVSFVRAMLVEPEVMVFDSVFDGLTREESARVVRCHEVFRMHYPFRTAVFVGYSADLPAGIPVRERAHV